MKTVLSLTALLMLTLWVPSCGEGNGGNGTVDTVNKDTTPTNPVTNPTSTVPAENPATNPTTTQGNTPAPQTAPKNELVSRSSDSSVTGSGESPAISQDGRFIAFVSNTANLAPGASGRDWQVFVHDRQSHQTELVSVTPEGAEGNKGSFAPTISSDGRYVAFESYSSDLVSGDTNGVRDVFIRDRQTHSTSRVSVGAGGLEANDESRDPAISANGRYVAFSSYADNLTAGVTGNSALNVYERDLQTSAITLISATASGVGAGGRLPAISADGSRIAFYSNASTLVAGDANGLWDIFLHDSGASPRIRLVSVSSEGVQKNQGDESMSRIVTPAISADGNFVAFATTADNLVAGDTNGLQDVFVHKVDTGETIRASTGANGEQANGDSPWGQGERVAISADGTWVAFTTGADNIAAGGKNVLIHNNLTGETMVVTEHPSYYSGDRGPALSGDGRYVAFESSVQLDPRFASSGVFVQDRTLP